MEETTTNNYEMYKELLEIENEDAIQVGLPRDLHGSLRALKYSLDNPVIIRPPPNSSNRDANSITNKSRTMKSDSSTLPSRVPVTIPKLAQINEILDHLKERDPRTEIQLTSNNANYNKHYRNVSYSLLNTFMLQIFHFFLFLSKVEKRYQQIKSEFNATT